MFSETSLENIAKIRDDFQNAKPFKHVCVDNFLSADIAEKLIEDFPIFDQANARDEFGAASRKAVKTDLASISDFYADIYRTILSPEFLATLSDMIGIPDLHADASLYGGGTHENLDGQALDPHVDFNFLHNAMHRRVNLLIYLNEEWEESWGGSIEIHSNPRRPAENEIKAYNVTFNRAVIFETNEYSWHGFPRIRLPGDKKHLSRKCLSLYFYTKDRPVEERAGRHGTFYIPRPLSTAIASGVTLSDDNFAEIRDAISARDAWLEYYQKLESKLGDQMEALERSLDEARAAVHVPVTGYGVPSDVSGLNVDGWAGQNVSLALKPSRDVKALRIRGWLPDNIAAASGTLLATVGNDFKACPVGGGAFEFELPARLAAGQSYDLTLRSDLLMPKTSGDMRDVSYILNEIELVHA